MDFTVNNSPFAGQVGKFVTTRQVRERLYRELVRMHREEGLDFVDRASVSHGKDGVMRYTVVVRSASGASSVFHEGLRCHEVVCELLPAPLVGPDEPKETRPDISPPVARTVESDPGHDLKTTIPCEPSAACCLAGS